MSTVAQDVQQIREAIYGREVREAIADGIEHCYSDVSSGATTANAAAAAANAAAQRANTAAAGAEGIPGTASLEDVNNIKSTFSGPRVPTGNETKLSDMRLNGVYKLERANVSNLTDLPDGAEPNVTSTLVNSTNFYSGGNFIQQDFYQLSNKVWRRLITSDGATVYTPWFRIPITDQFQARTVPSSISTFAALVELGVYNIPTNVFNRMSDAPAGAVSSVYTLLVFPNSYNGQYTTQILIDINTKVYCRMIGTSDGVILHDWFVLHSNHLYYDATPFEDGATTLASLRNPGSYNIPSNRFDSITDWPDGLVRGTYTLFNITNAFAGTYIIQHLYTVNADEQYFRIINFDGTIYLDWVGFTNNGIVYAAIGDSRTQKTAVVNVAYPDVVKKIKRYKTVYNWGIGGSTYVKISERTSAYEICSAHSFANVDVVSMCWGFNDYGRNLPIGQPGDTDDTTVCGAIYKCLNKIYSDNPKCAVFVFTPLPNKNVINNASSRAAFDPYVSAIIATCEKYGVAVYNSEDGGLPLFVVDSFFDYDETHSTDYTIWGTWIASHLP